MRRSLLIFRGFGPGDVSRRRDVTPVASPTNGGKECHKHRHETNKLLEHVRTRTQRRGWESRISKHATAALKSMAGTRGSTTSKRGRSWPARR